MWIPLRRLLGVLFAVGLVATSRAATFGTVVPVRGTVSDIALDERRGLLYIANFTANRIEVMSTADRTLLAPIVVSDQPNSLAMSPDNRFLVVGHYVNFPDRSIKGGFTILDLDAGLTQQVATASPVLAVAFGAGSKALAATSSGFLLLDPLTARTESVDVAKLGGQPLPAAFATFPLQITRAASGVSGDGQTILMLAEVTEPQAANLVLRYGVGSGEITAVGLLTSPALGPRVLSVDRDGSNYLVGWALLDANFNLRAQFPAASGVYNIGSHAYDSSRNVIYAHVPAPGDAAVMHVADTDNLTIRERIQLPQNLAGRSLFSSDMQTMYAVSVSGVTVLPVGALDRAPRVIALDEDVVFQGDACNRRVITKTLDLVDPAGNRVDFTLSLPADARGIRLSPSSGTTPARVRIEVDPTAYQNLKGTLAVQLTIQSAGAVNSPPPVRLLINTRDFDQRGRFVNVPGKIVDILADRFRNRIYMVRQDRNVVLVRDATTFRQIAALRTGNTPMQMAITADQRFLIVGNDNSQFASVFDLETLEASDPIQFPFGNYPRSFAVGMGAIWATARSAGSKHQLHRIDFSARTASAPATLGIYDNKISPDSVLAASPGGTAILLAQQDGTVALWDAYADAFVAARQDLKALGGAYGALNENLFVVDNNIYDGALVPIGKLQAVSGASSGVGLAGGFGLRTTTGVATGPGFIERVDLVDLSSFHGTKTGEAAVLVTALRTPPVGQIGQSILPFVRTLAMPADQSSIITLSASGLTVLAPDFDAPTPTPAVSRVVNAADSTTAVAPGGLVVISGANLAPGPAGADGLPLPSALGDICATVNSVALPLFRVSSKEIMAQLPFTMTGDGLLTVRAPGGISSGFRFTIQSFAPAIFRTGQAGDDTGLATVVRLRNNELVTFSNPIHPDEMLSIYLTGLGSTSPEPALGDGAPLDPLAQVASPPEVTLGNVKLGVTFAGLVPGEVGVYQIDVHVPRSIVDGVDVPLTITQASFSTELRVRVVNP